MKKNSCKEKPIQHMLYIIRSRATKLVIVLFLLPILFSGCGRKPAAKAGDLQGNIAVSGAFALYPLMLRWADAFSQRQPGVTIDVSAGGSGKGVTDVLAGQVDLGMVSRDLKAPERQHGAVAVAVALFGASSPAALATTVGVLTEVPVMLTLVEIANHTKRWFPREP